MAADMAAAASAPVGAPAAVEVAAQLGFTGALVRLSHLVQHVFADVSRDLDITPQQAQLLCLLIEGPLGMSDLGRLLHLEKSSLTGLVDRVEQRGLVARVRSTRDRRACEVGLTDAGRRLAISAHEDVTRRLEALADGVRDADREHVAVVLAGLLTRHGTLVRRTSAAPNA